MSDTGAAIVVDDSMRGVRVLTLNRPARLNAFDGPMLERLAQAIAECADPSHDIRVIVLQGSGRAFSAGADLKWLAGGITADAAAYQAFQDRLQAVCDALESAPQATVASVHGLALAGGLELALACDIIVATDDAQLGDEHIRRNLLPGGGGSQRLPRRIGLVQGLYHLLTGRRMTGSDAQRLGLAALAVPAADLEATTRALSEQLANTAGDALSAMKRMVRQGLDMPLRDGLQLERWLHQRYRAASSTSDGSIAAFAGGKAPTAQS